METRRDVFQGIADPTRRQIIEMVARKPRKMNEIAEHFDVSRQAISLHVKILTECGLITVKQAGRERLCEAKLGALGDVTNWVTFCQKFWQQQFMSLETFLQKTKPKTKRSKRK